MPAPLIVPFQPNEKLTSERFNALIAEVVGVFGSLDGGDFVWPLTMDGDMDMLGHRLLRVREMFGALNVEEFGTDQDAFEEAISELENGGLLFIPRDTTITLTRSIKIRSAPNRVYIVGSGYSSRIKIASAADDPAISIEGSRQFLVSNLSIDGNGLLNSSAPGISVRKCSEFEISRVWVGSADPATGTAGAGIRVEQSDAFAIKRSWVRSSIGPGIHISDGCSNFDVTEVTVDSPSDSGDYKGDGILVQASDGGRIHGNHISSPANDGVSLVNSKNMMVYGNTMAGGATSVDAISVSGENEDNYSDGIMVFANSAANFDVGVEVGAFVRGVIHSNNLKDCAKPISMTSKENVAVTLRNNMVGDFSHHGVLTMPAGTSRVNLALGRSQLPIQAVHANWKYQSAITNLRQMTISAAYGVLGASTVTFHTAKTRTDPTDFYYSIFT